jgi:hypothetical protein
MMELETRTINLSIGGSFSISENDFPAARKLHRLTEEARAAVNGDSTALAHFRASMYPTLAATAVGDVPDVLAAYALPRAELDAWWLDVWELNRDWFDQPVNRAEPATEVVTFRDGSSLTVCDSRDLPSFILRLIELEDQAEKNPSPDEDTQVFRLYVYPKMAACVISDNVPGAEEVFHWPSSERMKWYDAARRMNWRWFKSLDAASEAAQSALEEKQTKKKERSRGVASRPTVETP